MKKLIVLLAAAVMILPLASCGKQDKPTKEVVMQPAATADVAKVVSFEKATGSNPTYTKGGTTYEILSIEFTEGSRYILRRRPMLAGSGIIPFTKADSGVQVVTGKFTESNGKYSCQGEFEGTVEPKGNSADVTPQGGQTQSAPASVQNTSNNTTEGTNASRTWKVNDCFIKISGNGINIETGFNGCDFKAIADFAASKGVKIDPSKLAGYQITEVMFTGEKTMTISFASATSFYGSYTLNGENISYTLTTGGNDLMGASANGTLTFPADGKADLLLNTTVKGYTGSISMSMTEVK